MTVRIEGFIIHLERAAQRLPQVERLRRTLPMPVEVIDAVDGRELTQAQVDAVYRPGLHRPRYPFALGKGEIACFLSHRKAWQEIVDRKLDAGLIVEDDVEVDADRFSPALALALTRSNPNAYVRFTWRDHTDAGRQIAASDGVVLMEPKHAGLGMLAQLVGAEAAARLLKATETFDRPVDTFIQMRWMHGARILALRGAGISHQDDRLGGTTLHVKGRSPAEKISREISRTLYRLSLRYMTMGKG